MEVLLDPVRANLDIVLVHGLNVWNRDNHENDTWTARTPSGEVHWVREALPLDTDTSRARVLVHAYNSSEVFETAQSGVAVQAEGLLNRLLLMRKGVETRPLIFIAHSLGGIVVKEVLVQANESDGRLHCISYFTTAVMFFGTPHRGVDTSKYQILANLLRQMTSDPDPLLLASLNRSSPECERLHTRFSTVHAHYQYVSVYETRPHRIKELGVLVPMLSAVLGLPDDKEVRIHLDRDHSQICRFDDLQSGDFLLVFSNLRDLCQRSINSFSGLDHMSEPGRWATEELAAQTISDGESIQQAILDARNLLQSTDTIAGVQDLGESISTHQNSTNSYIALCLIPLILGILPLLSLLGSLGLLFGQVLVAQIEPMIGWVANGLEDVRTGQIRVISLCSLTIQLLDRRFHSVEVRKKTLEGHLRSTPATAEEANEARGLITRLDTHSSQLFSELHRRRESKASMRGRLKETDEFLARLHQAQQEPPESWLGYLGRLLMSIVRWLRLLITSIFSPFFS